MRVPSSEVGDVPARAQLNSTRLVSNPLHPHDEFVVLAHAIGGSGDETRDGDAAPQHRQVAYVPAAGFRSTEVLRLFCHLNDDWAQDAHPPRALVLRAEILGLAERRLVPRIPQSIG